MKPSSVPHDSSASSFSFQSLGQLFKSRSPSSKVVPESPLESNFSASRSARNQSSKESIAEATVAAPKISRSKSAVTEIFSEMPDPEVKPENPNKEMPPQVGSLTRGKSSRSQKFEVVDVGEKAKPKQSKRGTTGIIRSTTAFATATTPETEKQRKKREKRERKQLEKEEMERKRQEEEQREKDQSQRISVILNQFVDQVLRFSCPFSWISSRFVDCSRRNLWLHNFKFKSSKIINQMRSFNS